MSFKIGNTVNKKITLEQLIAGLDAVKDKKKIDRITLIFNKYNTNKTGSSENSLDLDEQVAMMNEMHKADGADRDRNFDGKVGRGGLRQAGLEGEYKAYRDFMEAYQAAIAEDNVNTYELTFKDDTIEWQEYTGTSATQVGQNTTVEHEYSYLAGQSERLRTTQTDAEGAISRDPKGRMTRQVIGNTTIQYRSFDSDARNAAPGIITVREGSSYITLKRQDDGTYLNEADNSHYRLNKNCLLDEFLVDDKNRITFEYMDDDSISYEYEGEDTNASTITLNAGTEAETVFTRDGDLYTMPDGENTAYFNFDKEKRVFTETDAPLPPEPVEVIEKHARPNTRTLIRMTAGWKNQKVKPDADTTSQFNSMSKADEVLAVLVSKNEAFKDTALNTEQLLADLIKNNPSVFDANGIIYSNADWQKLDFPTDLSRYVKTE